MNNDSETVCAATLVAQAVLSLGLFITADELDACIKHIMGKREKGQG